VSPLCIKPEFWIWLVLFQKPSCSQCRSRSLNVVYLTIWCSCQSGLKVCNTALVIYTAEIIVGLVNRWFLIR